MPKELHCGPLAEWTTTRDGRRVRTLKPEGVAVVEEFMAKYAPPVKLFSSKCQSMYMEAVRCGFTNDAVNDMCTTGVVKAAVKFEPARGFTFSTYAKWWMKAEVSRAIAQQHRQVFNVYPMQFAGDCDDSPDPIDTRGETADQRDERCNAVAVVANLLDKLNDKERELITLRYGIGGTGPLKLDQIADLFGICKERVRQVQGECLAKLWRHRRRLKEAV